MVKVFAPHPASWRGTPIEIAADGSAEIPQEALTELEPHGYRRWTEDDDDRVKHGGGENPDNMSRKDLIELLKGKTEGRVILMSTDDLRGIAKKVLGIEAPATDPAGDGAKAADAKDGDDTKTGEVAGADANAETGEQQADANTESDASGDQQTQEETAAQLGADGEASETAEAEADEPAAEKAGDGATEQTDAPVGAQSESEGETAQENAASDDEQDDTNQAAE